MDVYSRYIISVLCINYEVYFSIGLPHIMQTIKYTCMHRKLSCIINMEMLTFHMCAPKVEMEDYSHISKIEILLPIPCV